MFGLPSRGTRQGDDCSLDASPGVSPFVGPVPPAPDATLPEASALAWALVTRQADPRAALQTVLAEPLPTRTVDIAAQLVNLAGVRVQADLSSDLIDPLASATLDRVNRILERLPASPTDAALGHAAVIISSLAWPALPGARTRPGASWRALPAALRRHFGADGAPLGPLPQAAQILWVLALARAFSLAAGHPPEHAVDSTLIAAVDALWRVCGDTPTLANPGPLTLGATPLPHVLRNLVVAWGLDRPPLAHLDDPASACLASVPDAPLDEPMATPDWRLWSWRESGVHVAWRQVFGVASRLLLGPQGIRWSRGDLLLGERQGAVGGVRSARTDRQSARVDLLDGTRVIVRRAVLKVDDPAGGRWTFDPRWRQDRETLRYDGLALQVQHEGTPAPLVSGPRGWSLEAPTGRLSIELRQDSSRPPDER